MPDYRAAPLTALRHARASLRGALRQRGEFTYAQEGEDRVVARILGSQPKGFYVDIGAHDPVRFSNTYLFYRMGWRGIAIEPAPAAAKAFARVRPRDTILTLAVGSQQGTLPYYEFDEPALNTLSADRAADLAAHTSYRLLRTASVEVQTLDAILTAHLPAGTAIDLLSVDTEGMDLDVLESNDWTRFRPRIVVVELLGMPELGKVDSSPTTKALRDREYVPVAKTGNSVIFVAKGIILADAGVAPRQ